MTDFKTADLCDQYSDKLKICEPEFSSYGGKSSFYGPIVTVKCFEDNSRVRDALSQDGHGNVLVVDAGASKRCAMLGDMLAQMAVDNGWAGVLMNGYIRDSADIAKMPLGVMALGTFPLKSVKKGVGETEVAVRFSGINFRPGYYLYADEDGIIVSREALDL